MAKLKNTGALISISTEAAIVYLSRSTRASDC